jgi:hypothetical protein
MLRSFTCRRRSSPFAKTSARDSMHWPDAWRGIQNGKSRMEKEEQVATCRAVSDRAEKKWVEQHLASLRPIKLRPRTKAAISSCGPHAGDHESRTIT